MKKNIFAATKKQITYKGKTEMIYSYLYSVQYNKFYIEVWNKQGFLVKGVGKNAKTLFAQIKKRFALDITDFGYNY